MFSKRELSRNLLGCLEIALFMPAGAKRFCKSYKGMAKSFLIPFLVLPLTLITVIGAHPNPELPLISAKILIAVYSLRVVAYLGVFLAIMYFMAKNLDRLECFYQFATANNWLTIPAALLMAPLLFLFLTGAYSFQEVYPLMVFITLYSYAYTAFMATHIMRIPWELACFVAVISMAIHQSSLDLLKWAAAHAVYYVL